MTEGECEVDNINRYLKGVFGLPRLRVCYKPQYQMLDSGNLVVEKHQWEIGRRKLKLLKKVNIAGGKQSCSITDIATPSNETFPVILVDCVNQRLIIISDEYSVVYHQLEYVPWAITFISYDSPNGEIAITCPKENRILFFTICQKISEGKRSSIKVEYCIGIRYHTSENVLIVAVTNNGNANIQCWSLDGHLVRTIASFGYDIDRLSLTNDGQIICVCKSKHTVKSYDMSGKLLRCLPYIDDSMRGPYGIASDQSQSIYVCGFKCLRVVSRDGEWDELLTSDDGFAPQSLLVSNKSDRLYVGQGKCKEFSHFLIFEL
jgi:WD40 repeat protein